MGVGNLLTWAPQPLAGAWRHYHQIAAICRLDVRTHLAGAAAMMTLPILQHGSCEPLKAGVHGAALGLAAVMGLYNAAAWLRRRERHLWVNAVVYGLAIAFEKRHVARHVHACRDLAACRKALADAAADSISRAA